MPERRPYKPRLVEIEDGRFEQEFTANVVHVDDVLVAFGELIPDPDRPLPAGTPVHSLMLHLPSDEVPFMAEFNDQGNTRYGEDVEAIELGRTDLRVRFSAGPYAGRVSYSEASDPFEDERPDGDDRFEFDWYERYDDIDLASLRIRFDLDETRHAELKRQLARTGKLTGG
jgi:hypothetical protein